MSRSPALAAPLLAAIAFACGADHREAFPASPDAGAATPVVVSPSASVLPDDACSKMDILLVVDNSGSMKEEQANLTANFAVLTQRLDQYTTASGAQLDYRIAVTTTGRSARYKMTPELPGMPPLPTLDVNDKGDDGRFRRACSMSHTWLERGEPDLSSNFSCVANVGAGGPALEMPLESLRLAVTTRMGDSANAGFLRDDALLGVMILTDEDDCSRTDNDFTIKDDTCPPGTPGYAAVDDYVSALDAVKGGRERWAAAVIAGPTNCSSGFGQAGEATRLKDFVAKTGQNAVFGNICLGDLVKPLENALGVFDAACKKFKVK